VAQLSDVWELIQTTCCAEWIDRDGQPLTATRVNLYDATKFLLKPRTEPYSCSYVELVARGPQPPDWFVSHWWGEVVAAFFACIEGHAKLRHVARRKTRVLYWVCAYANNQWELDAEIAEDPAQTSFRKAMALSRGTVTVLDEKAVTFSRIWCCYELATTIREGKDKLYDVATAVGTGSNAVVAILADGLSLEDEVRGADGEWEHRGGGHGYKAWRERGFPIARAARALQVRLEDGDASVEQDRVRILNSILGETNLAALVERPFERSTHDKFDRLNVVLRWRFGVAMYAVAAEAGELQRYGLDNLQEPDPSDVGKTYWNMAEAFRKQGKVALAEEFFIRDLRIEAATVGEESPGYAITLSNLAMVVADQGDVGRAIELYNQVLKIQAATIGEESPEYANTLNNLAVAVEDQGDVSRAIELYEQILKIEAAAIGEESPGYAIALNNLAKAVGDQGDLDRAIELYNQVLKIKAATIGEESPGYATTLSNLARAVEDQGDVDRAIELYNQVLKIEAVTIGEESPGYASTLNNLAVAVEEQGDVDRAVELYEQILKIQAATIGEESPGYAITLGNLAMTVGEQGDVDRAMELYEQVLKIQAATIGEESPGYATTLNNLAMAVESQGDVSRAIELYEQILKIKAATIGKESPSYAITLVNLAVAVEKQGDVDRAIELYNQALKIMDATIGNESPNYATVAKHLARAVKSKNC